ncbi:hypothetical protein [Streptomyces sp. DI166]|nr:hypothetical protein [Streptomyces sp. DI166]
MFFLVWSMIGLTIVAVGWVMGSAWLLEAHLAGDFLARPPSWLTFCG